MPTLLNKIKNRWNASSSPTPSYHIGPITPANHGRWRSRLAKLLGINGTTPLRTASYRPLYQSWFSQPRDLPPFSFETIHSMLMDPGIRLNLAMRAAPIYGVQFAYPAGTDASGKTIYQSGVQATNPAVAAWVQRQLNTIWHNDLPAILRSQVYGWVGGEVSLRLSNQNLIEIDKLVARHPGDIRLLKLDGERYGVKVLRVQEGGEVDLEFPSAWFHAFRPDDGEDYGTSILLGAYSPWADKWFNGGALDTRRLFMHKDAYGGMKIAYPEEEIYIGDAVNPVSARDIAAQMVEQRKAGGTITYPSTLDAQGNPKWRVEEATTANNPQHILQYPKDCDDEIRVGMEIPDDVISHDGSGAWAGKRIPLAAFYAGLDTWVVQILTDLRKTLEPLILLNWGKAEDFEICHKPLALQAMEAVATQASAAPSSTGRLSPEIMGAVNSAAGATGASGSQRMSLRSEPNTTPHAHSGQALDASDRLSPQNRGTANSNRARAIAALLTRIYGPDAESYFDEAYGIESSSDSRHDPDRDPYEFKRLSAYVSRPTSLHRIPWDESKHPRGRDGRFIEKYSADALTHTQQRISESLDPNHVPTTGRTSDDVRNLLDHFNLLDDTQVNTLLNEHAVAPDQAPSRVPHDSLIQKIAHQVQERTTQDTSDDTNPSNERPTDDADIDEKQSPDEEPENNDGNAPPVVNELESEQEPTSDPTNPGEGVESHSSDKPDDEEEQESSDEPELLDEQPASDGNDEESASSSNKDNELPEEEWEENLDESNELESHNKDALDNQENTGEIVFGDPSALAAPKVEYSQGRFGKIARVVEPPPEKVLEGALEAGQELYQTIADIPLEHYDGKTVSTQKIREGRDQTRANIAVLSKLRSELYKLASKYLAFNQGRGLGLYSHDRIKLIQEQLGQLSKLIAEIDKLVRTARESEHVMYQQELIAEQRENAKLPKKVTRGIVHQIPSKVQPSLVQGDINFYSREIAFTIGTAAIGGFAIRLAGKGLEAIKAARAARGTTLPNPNGRFGARSIGAAETPRPGRMHQSKGKFTDGEGYTDFEIFGRSKPEVFAARMIDGSKMLAIDWTESIGFPTLVRRIKKVQELSGGPGSITIIKGQASDNLRLLIAKGAFNTDDAARLVGEHLGGIWKVELIPVRNSVPSTWNIFIKRIGD